MITVTTATQDYLFEYLIIQTAKNENPKKCFLKFYPVSWNTLHSNSMSNHDILMIQIGDCVCLFRFTEKLLTYHTIFFYKQ